jgi:RHS repeat-associated protein
VITTYVNKFYEKTGTEVTTNYYLGSKLIAVRKGTTLSYILQDHLGSTSVTADSSGAAASTIAYLPFGSIRSSTGTQPTDRLFTGQRLDSTGLYYYGARYYDPSIGRFISPDTVVHTLPLPEGRIIESLVVSLSNTQNQFTGNETRSLYREITNPQELNRYSYVLNNPLKYIDPTGNQENVAAQLSQNAWQLSFSLPPGWPRWVAAGGAVILGFAGWVWYQASSDSSNNDSDTIKTNNSGNTANGDPNNFGKPPKGDFRDKLQKYTGATDEQIQGKQAHHILPQEFRDTFWNQYRIDIDSPQFGTWVDNTHYNWSKEYNTIWRQFLQNNPTKEQIFNFGKELADKFNFEVLY